MDKLIARHALSGLALIIWGILHLDQAAEARREHPTPPAPATPDATTPPPPGQES